MNVCAQKQAHKVFWNLYNGLMKNPPYRSRHPGNMKSPVLFQLRAVLSV